MSRLLKVGAVLAIASVVAFVLAVNLNNSPGRGERVAKNRTDALAVVAALEAHKVSTGKYPKTLAELVPTYLPALPVMQMTENGEPDPSRLFYEVAPDGTRFALSYPVEPMGGLPSDMFNRYGSDTRQWTVTD